MTGRLWPPGGDELFKLHHVLRRPDKGQGHQVNAQFHAKGQIVPVLGGDGRNGEHHPRQIDALVGAQGPPHHHPADEGIRGLLQDLELQGAVRQQHRSPHRRSEDDLGGVDGTLLAVAGDGAPGQGKGLPRDQGDGLGIDIPQPDLGPRQVLEDGHRPPGFCGRGPDHVIAGPVLLVGAVGKIQPGHIEAGLHQSRKDLPGDRRPDGADNLGSPHLR